MQARSKSGKFLGPCQAESCISFRSSALQKFPTKSLCSPPILDFSIISSSKINFYNLGAPLRRLAEGHPGELPMKFPSGWASVPGSLE